MSHQELLTSAVGSHAHPGWLASDLAAADECLSGGTTPRETFEDGYVVNAIIDSAYRSMRSGHWERVETDAAGMVA